MDRPRNGAGGASSRPWPAAEELRGIFVILSTPYTESSALDYEDLAFQVEWLQRDGTTETIPFVMPVVRELGIDPICFGVFVVVMSEVALVTPPVGANVFVMRRAAPDVPMTEIFLGVLPFVLGELVVIALLIAFPSIATWLPAQMG